MSALTGHGAGRDKAESFLPHSPPTLTDEQLAWLHDGNDLIASMVERVPFEMLREGYSVLPKYGDGSDEDPKAIELGEAIVHHLEDLEVPQAIQEGMVDEAVFGGAIAMMLAHDGGNLASPLDLERVQSFRGLKVYDRRSVQIVELYDDPKDRSFGKPKLFKVTRETDNGDGDANKHEFFIHATRCVFFPGIKRADTKGNQDRQGWGQSMIERTYKAFRSHAIAWSSSDHLLTDASQGVWKMKGFHKGIADNKEDLILKRLAIADQARSTVRAVVLDAEGEDFYRNPHGLGGIEKILQEYNQRVSAAARQPMTLLFGMSPAGLNSTGDSDRKIFNNSIKVSQVRVLEPILDRIIEVATAAIDGPTDGRMLEDWEINFAPLEQMTETESMDIRVKQAQVDAIEIDKGMLYPEEVALSRHRVTGWSSDTVLLDRKVREQAIEDEFDRMNEPDPEPTPPPESEGEAPLMVAVQPQAEEEQDPEEEPEDAES